MNSIRNSQHKMITLDNSSLMQIIPDGCRLWKAIQMMRSGLPWEEIAARTTEKTPKRAFKMLELISSKRGGMVLKTPLELGLIEAIAWDVETRKPSVFKPTQSGMLHLMNGDFFGKVDQIDLMENRPVWVALYGPKDRPDMGTDMWKAVQPHFAKAMSDNDLAEMKKGLGKLIGILLKDQDSTDHKQEISKRLADIYPLQDEELSNTLTTLEQLDDMTPVTDEDDEEEYPISDMTDDAEDSMFLEDFLGKFVTTQDPDLKKKVQVAKLIQAKESDNPQQVWEEVVSPILDSYTGKGVYGPDVEYVNMPLTEEQKQKERDRMPWDTPMFSERYRKGYTQVLATVEKMTKKGTYAKYDEYMINPEGKTYWTDKYPHTPRPISEDSAVKVREVSMFLPALPDYNLDDVDFQVEAAMRSADMNRQRRLMLLGELLKNPEFKKLTPDQMRLEIQLLAGDPESIHGALCNMAVNSGEIIDFTQVVMENVPPSILFSSCYSIFLRGLFTKRDLGCKPYRSRILNNTFGNEEDSQQPDYFLEAYKATNATKSSPKLVRA